MDRKGKFALLFVIVVLAACILACDDDVDSLIQREIEYAEEIAEDPIIAIEHPVEQVGQAAESAVEGAEQLLSVGREYRETARMDGD